MPSLWPDPTKPRIQPRPDFQQFCSQAFVIPIGSDLSDEDAKLAQAIYPLASRYPEVLFEIDSNGGNPSQIGVINELILDLMETKVDGKLIDVRAIVREKCFSAALTVLMTFPAEARYCESRSKFLIHAANFGSDQPRLTPEGKKLLDSLNRLYVVDPISAGTLIDRDSLQAAVNSESDYYLNAAAALELGIVTAIVT